MDNIAECSRQCQYQWLIICIQNVCGVQFKLFFSVPSKGLGTCNLKITTKYIQLLHACSASAMNSVTNYFHNLIENISTFSFL